MKKHIILCFSYALVLLFQSYNAMAASVDHRAERMQLIAQLVKQTGLAEPYVKPLIIQAKFDRSIIKRITTPYEGKAYSDYRKLFVDDAHIRSARAYLKEHKQVFDTCEQRYGVQREMIAAILSMETRFGGYMGRDRVLDSLFTLSVGYPRRAKFFRGELAALLLLAQEEGLDPSTMVGSYAGAFGVTQFIPTSFRGYAVDANHDGKRDVWHTPLDIVCSVGHYFQQHHWDASRPIMQWLPATKAATSWQTRSLKQWHRFSELRATVNQPAAIWRDDDRVNIIKGGAGHGKTFALVHYNFYVITRWNRAFNYALAASELAATLSQKEGL
jgi:membrane-bound lytic murein transglycosylase B